MGNEAIFKAKEDDTEISIGAVDLEEILPDADFRFSLLIMKNGDKHFVCGTEAEVRKKLGMPAE